MGDNIHIKEQGPWKSNWLGESNNAKGRILWKSVWKVEVWEPYSHYCYITALRHGFKSDAFVPLKVEFKIVFSAMMKVSLVMSLKIFSPWQTNLDERHWSGLYCIISYDLLTCISNITMISKSVLAVSWNYQE